MARLSAAIQPHFSQSDFLSALATAVVRQQPQAAGRLMQHTQRLPRFMDGQWGSLPNPDGVLAAAVRFCAAGGGAAAMPGWVGGAISDARGRFGQTVAALLEHVSPPSAALEELLLLEGLPAECALRVLRRWPSLTPAHVWDLVRREARRRSEETAELAEAAAQYMFRGPLQASRRNGRLQSVGTAAQAQAAAAAAQGTVASVRVARQQARALLLCMERLGRAWELRRCGKRRSARLAGMGGSEALPPLPAPAVDCILNLVLLRGLGVIE